MNKDRNVLSHSPRSVEWPIQLCLLVCENVSASSRVGLVTEMVENRGSGMLVSAGDADPPTHMWRGTRREKIDSCSWWSISETPERILNTAWSDRLGVRV